jgi:multidrug efflux pump subunit AcrA (membrane-fusion protein)
VFYNLWYSIISEIASKIDEVAMFKKGLFFIGSVLGAYMLFLMFTVVKYGYIDGGYAQRTDEENSAPVVSQSQESDETILEFGDEEVLPEVEVVTLESYQQNNTQTLRVSGEVQSEHSTELAAKANATVKAILVDIGDRVQPGQVLVDLSGNADLQQLFIQRDTLLDQIAREQDRLNLVKKSVKENTEIQKNTSSISVSDMQASLNDTKAITDQTIRSIEKQMQDIDEQFAKAESDRGLTDQGLTNSEDQLRLSASTSLVQIFDTIWLGLETAAFPLAELLEDETGDDDLMDDIEDEKDLLRDRLNDVSMFNIEFELDDAIFELEDLRSLLVELIEEVADESDEFDPSVSGLVSQYNATVSQTLTSIDSGLGSIESFILQLKQYPDSREQGLTGFDSSFLQLLQQKESLALQIEIQRLQLKQAEHQINMQINSAMGGETSLQWTLDALINGTHPDIKAIENQIASLQNNIRPIDAQIEDLSIKAPYEGIVADTFIVAGIDVNPGQSLLKLNTAAVEIKAFVDSSDIGYVQKGQIADIGLFGQEGGNQAKVIFIAPEADPESRDVSVTLESIDTFSAVPNSLLDIEFVINGSTTNSQFLPLKAVVFEGSSSYIFLYDAGIATKIPIEVGQTLGSNIEIISNLKPNTEVIIEGQKLLKGGENVKKK